MIRKEHLWYLPYSIMCVLLASCSDSTTPTDSALDAPGIEAIAAQGWEQIKSNSYNYADTQIDSLGHFATSPNGCHQDAGGALDIHLWNQIANLMNKALALPPTTESDELCFPRPDDSKLFGTVDVIVDQPVSHFWRVSFARPRPTPTPTFTPTPQSTPSQTARPSPTPTLTPTASPTVIPSDRPTVTPSLSPSPSPSPSGVTRTILEDRGNNICTTIPDMPTAQALISAFDQVAAIAFKEDCERVP